MDMQLAIITLFLGSIITFLSTVLTGVIIETFKLNKKRTSFKLRLNLELNQTIKNLDEIRTQTSRQNFYDYLLLSILEQSVNNLQEMRRDISLLGEEKVQEKAYDVIIKIDKLTKSMKNIQDFDNNQDPELNQDPQLKAKFIEEQKIRNDVDLIDLKRDIEALISLIS